MEVQTNAQPDAQPLERQLWRALTAEEKGSAALQLRALLPLGWNLKRLAVTAILASRKWKPEIRRNFCMVSFVEAVQRSAQCRIEPDGRRGHLIPRYSSQRKVYEISFEPDYKGLIDAIRAADPNVRSVHADCIYSLDRFEYVEGSERRFVHERPRPGKPRGVKEGAYAIVHFKDGGWQATVVPVDELEKIRAKSTSKNREGNPVGPHRDWPDEMDKKAAVKRLSKYLRLDPVLAAVVDADNARFEREPEKIALPVEKLLEAKAEPAVAVAEEPAEDLDEERRQALAHNSELLIALNERGTPAKEYESLPVDRLSTAEIKRINGMLAARLPR